MENNKTEDYRLAALQAAASLKHETVQELLTSADRIEQWLWEPMIREQQRKTENTLRQNELLKKIMSNT